MWFGFFGMIGWTWVGYLWNDRAILVLNAVSLALLAVGLLNFYRP